MNTMSAMKPTYYLPPNFSTPPPPTGPFHLGTVLKNFERREEMRPLNQNAESRIPIPADQIYFDYKGGFEATRIQLKSGGLGLWAEFIGIDGIGAEASISVDRNDSDKYKFESVQTMYFFPRPSYISQCIQISDVQDYLEGHNYKKPVYLITGLKVAKGVSLQIEKIRKAAVKAEVGLNNPGGSNTSIGPRIEGNVANSPVFSFAESSDIVVGLQCLKLYYKIGWFGSPKKLKEELVMNDATFVSDENKGQYENLDNYVIPEPEDYKLVDYIRRSLTSDEETWIVPEC